MYTPKDESVLVNQLGEDLQVFQRQTPLQMFSLDFSLIFWTPLSDNSCF